MANGTLDDGSRVSLQLFGGNVVIGLGIRIGPNGVGTAMTGFAGQSAVSFAVAKQGVVFFSKSFVCRY
jgi:hypothetical protein